jgi:hypothetical protein
MLAVVALASCGSGSSEATGSEATAITKAELIKKGDAICRKTDEIQTSAWNAYGKKHPEVMATKAAAIKALKKVGLPPIGTEIDELAALGAPGGGDQAKMTKILAGFERGLEALERKPSLGLKLTGGPFADPDQLAAQYGFKDCADAL